MVYKTIFTALVLSGLSFAADVPYNLRIRNVQAAPDGFQRSVVSVNGLIPGALITANKGDTLLINVTNELTDASMRRATTIHWHGLFQAKTASEDGPAFVTQCPISQFSSYTYRIPLGQQTGTFWYHSHLSSQYADGLRGPLVVYDPQDPHRSRYDVDDASTIIVLEDWYHTPAPTLQAQFFDTNNTALAAPVPDSGLVNGRGRYVGGPQAPRSVINVQRGRRYRFRVINTSAIGSYTFSIENHRMTIIEADGIPHQPLVVDSFQIYAGQRYSVVVEANQTVANYWVRSPMTVANAANNPNLDATNVFAILHYQGAPNAEPTTEQGTAIGTPLVEENLHALINPGAPGGSNPADVQVNLTIGRTTIDGSVAFTFNGIQYHSPSLPTLLKILANNATTNADFGTDEHTLTLPFNKTIELVITGGVDHPIHLHGHVFDVVQSLGGSINYVNPPRRDVVRVSSTGVILRFRTDNPGPWFVHCHIDWHLEAGLAVVFAEAPSETRTGAQRVVPAPGWDQLCPKYASLPAALQ
ncbi:Multicopper oxidase [Rhizoctonia solani]|uniref:Multicopper oxidase n=1 Tax=Rhizoctonia solani TaxID=456999 RepID=A0A8H8NZC3_9AGAM|nr:Multicopper oxidase [Rhizoctonia solani]QRW22330.1 Multicopper oxidase [Rhizoctonia solani]